MRFQGFIGPSYTLQSVNVDCQRCINLYPEMDELGTGKEGEVMSLVPTPGLRLLCTLPTGPVRGTYTDSTGQLWAVGGNTLYTVSTLWAWSPVGTLNTSTGPVSMADNGSTLVVVDGPYGYYCLLGQNGSGLPVGYSGTVTTGGTTTLVAGAYEQIYFTGTATQTVVLPVASTMAIGPAFNIVNLSTGVVTVQTSGGSLIATLPQNSQVAITCANPAGGTGTASWAWFQTVIGANTFSQITDPVFQGASQVTFMDQYLIFVIPNTQDFLLSYVGGLLPFDGGDVTPAEANPDNLVGLVAMQEQLYLFGTQSVEIFYNTGNATRTFQRVQGAVIEIGCMSGFTIGKIQDTVYWLGQDANGRGVVYRAQGYVPQRVSTFAIESEIATLGDLSQARAFVYQQAGHDFYCLNLPGATQTWVFDATTSLWHERTFLSQGAYQRGLPDCHAYAYSTNVVGDYSNGNLYALDPTVATDNGTAIVRERTAPHLGKDMKRLFHSAFQLDIEVGVGSNGTGQGVNPQAMLQWSNDQGHSWSNEHWTSIGAIGARKTRVIWRRLGASRDRVYRVRISDPNRATFLGAEIDLEQGTS